MPVCLPELTPRGDCMEEKTALVHGVAFGHHEVDMEMENVAEILATS